MSAYCFRVGCGLPSCLEARLHPLCGDCRFTFSIVMDRLAHNLAIGAALCRSYDLGWDQCIESEDSLAAFEENLQTQDEHNARLAALWQPGCEKSAP